MYDADNKNIAGISWKYTKFEKIKNWFYYYKWYVLIVLIIILVCINLIRSYFNTATPDYQFAYIGSYYLPEDAVKSFEDKVALYGEDINNDGVVTVSLKQYVISSTDSSLEALQQVYAANSTLTADIVDGSSHFFLLEDPASFQSSYEVLVDESGKLTDTPDFSDDMAILWAECPALTELPLGSYSESVAGTTRTGNIQELFSSLYVAQRGYYNNTPECIEQYHTLWTTLTSN